MRLQYIFFLFFATFFNGYGQVIFVNHSSINGNGTSWDSAYNDLNSALESANFGDSIWIQSGTYTPTTCINCTEDDRLKSFVIKDGVKLFGGFKGNELHFYQRSITNSPTIFSGDIDGDNEYEFNSYSIVYSKNVSNNTLIDGIIIEKGYANYNITGYGDKENSGAGWYNVGAINGTSNPTLKNCTFRYNKCTGLGGAMINDGRNNGHVGTVFINCTFHDNEAEIAGGAVYNNGSDAGEGAIFFSRCKFTNNKSLVSGGAISNGAHQVGQMVCTINNCTFEQNEALKLGGCLYSNGQSGTTTTNIQNCTFNDNFAEQGAAIYLDAKLFGNAAGQIKSCTFVENKSTKQASCIFNQGGNSGNCNPIYEDCYFFNNHTDGSGGVFFNDGIEGVCNPTIKNCTFFDNNATLYGAAIYSIGKSGEANAKITNCLFAHNEAYSAGAIYSLGAVYGNSSPYITNCTFYKNKANTGGVIYNNASDSTGTAKATVTNCIIWDNFATTGPYFRNIYGKPTFQYSIVDAPDCQALQSGIGGEVTCSEILFNQNPQFLDASNYNFNLKPNSPAINFGDSTLIDSFHITTDLNGEDRINGNNIDLGVFEFSNHTNQEINLLAQSLDKTICSGDSLFIAVYAKSDTLLKFDWYKDSIPVINHQSSLQIHQIDTNDMGTYYCKIFNDTDTIFSDPIHISVNLALLVEANIETDTNTICSNESVEITSIIENGGTYPFYNWKLNGLSIDNNSPILNIDSLKNNDEIQLNIVSNEKCVVQGSVNSEPIQFTVLESNRPSINLIILNDTLCSGSNVFIQTQGQNLGESPEFIWTINGDTLSSNQSSLILDNIDNQDIISVWAINPFSCSSSKISLPASKVLYVANTDTPTTSITFEDESYCEGDLLIFQSSFDNLNANHNYFWYVNGINTGENGPVFESSTLKENDFVQLIIDTHNACLAEPFVYSNKLYPQIKPSIHPSISIHGNDMVCINEPISFQVQTSDNGAQPIIEWYVNNNYLSSGTNITVHNPTEGFNVFAKLKITDELVCTDQNILYSDTFFVEVMQIGKPKVNLFSDHVELCDENNVLVESLSEFGGNMPTYNWFFNDKLLSIHPSKLSLFGIKDGDNIYCTMESNSNCINDNMAISDTINFKYSPLLTPSISILSTKNPICELEEVTLNTETENQGKNPTFTWYLNGNPIGNQAEIDIDGLTSDDELKVKLVSDFYCLDQNEVFSEPFDTPILPNVDASIMIKVNNNQPLCLNDTVAVISSLKNGGTTPSFQWYINDILQDNTSRNFTIFEFAENDKVSCVFHSAHYCLTENPVMSNEIILSTENCTDDTYNLANQTNILVYPNPIHNQIFIQSGIFKNETIQLYDITGKLVIQDVLDSNLKVIATDFLLPGFYSLLIIGQENSYYVKILVKNRL